MKIKRKISLITSILLFDLFVLWTVLVKFIDFKQIGPNGSGVGFATINGAFHTLTGTNMTLYTVTDWLGLVAIAVAFGFAVLGLVQLISRRSLLKVDRSIIILGIFYIAVMATYMFFEYVVINYRPVLIGGYLEASYPSSTTMLVACVIPTAMMQLKRLIKIHFLKVSVLVILALFTLFMIVGRLVSGVHWLSDIIGGMLISASLVSAYYCAAECSE